MELLWVHLLVWRWLMLFLYTLKRIGYKIVLLLLSLITTDVDDSFVLLTSTENVEAFQNFLNGWHFNISFTIENEKQNMFSWLFMNIKQHPLLSAINLSLEDFILILAAFYHLLISLVLFTHFLWKCGCVCMHNYAQI